jgi:hypothetical protein
MQDATASRCGSPPPTHYAVSCSSRRRRNSERDWHYPPFLCVIRREGRKKPQEAQVDKLLLMVVHADVQETSLVGVETVLAIVPGCCSSAITRLASSWTRQWCIGGAGETYHAFFLIVVDVMRPMKIKMVPNAWRRSAKCWTSLTVQAT